MTITVRAVNAATVLHPALRAVEAATNTSGASRGRMPAFVPSDQLYYWSYAWQEAERKAKVEDYLSGRWVAKKVFDSTEEIAKVLGITANHVGVKLHRAVSQLRAMLQEP